MHKLFITDIVLILSTFLGGLYLYWLAEYNSMFLVLIFIIYIFSKIIGYITLPYIYFQEFIDDLTQSSKINKISGYEIFKGFLVVLLFIGSLILHPGLWIIESILVVLMRVWGKMYITNKNIINIK